MYINRYAKKAIASIMCAVTVLSVAACSSTDTEDTSSGDVSYEAVEKMIQAQKLRQQRQLRILTNLTFSLRGCISVSSQVSQ